MVCAGIGEPIRRWRVHSTASCTRGSLRRSHGIQAPRRRPSRGRLSCPHVRARCATARQMPTIAPIVGQGGHVRRRRGPARAPGRADAARRAPAAPARWIACAATRTPTARDARRGRDRARARSGSRGAARPSRRSPIRPSCRSAPAATTCSRRSRDHQVVVVAGETGSGKTTQLPKLCLELGRGVRGAIAHTQPRRLAARTVAERIAEELDVAARRGRRLRGALQRPLGRGHARAAHDRRPAARRDPARPAAAPLRHDHRRRGARAQPQHRLPARLPASASCPQRPDLKLVITSATIDPERFAAPLRRRAGRRGLRPHVPGRGPLPAGRRGGRPGRRDRRRGRASCCARARATCSSSSAASARSATPPTRCAGGCGADVEVLPLYARLSTAEQQRVFRPPSGPPQPRRARDERRRDVADRARASATSSTPGTARISRYSARLKVQRLPIEPISQASADQRKGRCGRTSDGICIRLYSEEDFEARPRFTDPEILRTSLAAVILQMAVAEPRRRSRTSRSSTRPTAARSATA